jgi:hypothetical protein
MEWFTGFEEFFTLVYGPLVIFGVAGLVVSSLIVAILIALQGLLAKR